MSLDVPNLRDYDAKLREEANEPTLEVPQGEPTKKTQIIAIYGKGGMDAIEVKNSSRIRPEDLRGLKAVREDYPTARLILLSRSTERLVIDGIMCLPVEEFLKGLTPGHVPISECRS